jgi:hypothetical protein
MSTGRFMFMISNEFLALTVPMEFCTNHLLEINWFICTHLFMKLSYKCSPNLRARQMQDNNIDLIFLIFSYVTTLTTHEP